MRTRRWTRDAASLAIFVALITNAFALPAGAADGVTVKRDRSTTGSRPTIPTRLAVEDVEAAVKWVRKHAKDYGVDPQRIGALGGSAGAHLTGLLATVGKGLAREGPPDRGGGVVVGPDGPGLDDGARAPGAG